LALKYNRKVAFRLKAKDAKQFVSIKSLQLGQQPMPIWFHESDFPLFLVKQVFNNEDGTAGK
jgi:hypothetical protein